MQIQNQNESFNSETIKFFNNNSQNCQDNSHKNSKTKQIKNQNKKVNQDILQTRYSPFNQQLDNQQSNLFQNQQLSNMFDSKVNFFNYSYEISIFQDQLQFLKTNWQKNQQFQTKIKFKNSKKIKIVKSVQDAINALNTQIEKLRRSCKQNNHEKQQKNVLIHKTFDQRLQKQRQKQSLYQNYECLQNQYQQKLERERELSLIVEQTKKIKDLNKDILEKIKQKQNAIDQKQKQKQEIVNKKKKLRSGIKQIAQKMKRCDYEEFQLTEEIDKLSKNKGYIENQKNDIQHKNYQMDRMYQQIKNLTNQNLALQNQKKDLQLFYKKIKKQQKEMLKTNKIQEQCQAQKIKYQQQINKSYFVVESDQQTSLNKHKLNINQVEPIFEKHKHQIQLKTQKKQDSNIWKLVQRYQQIKKNSHQFY